MGTKNFKVDTGLEVGNITLTAATGNVAIPVASQLTLGNVILRDNGDGKLRARNITDDADVEIVATLAATSTTQGNIQIGTNHIESTNTNGPISIRPNGTGVVGLFSNTVAMGRGGEVTIATGLDMPDVYEVDFAAGNLVLAPGTGLTKVTANTATTSAATGALVVTGGVGVGGNLWVAGNLTVEGNTTTINSSTLNVADAMVYIGSGNNADLIDLGIVGSFNPGTAQYGGLVRDASDSTWKLFSNVTTQPGTTVDFTSAMYANLQVGNLVASQGFVGINTLTPRGRLDINGGAGEGAILFGAGTITYPTAPTFLNGIVSKGSTSDARLMIQDGNGRLSDYWNSYRDAGGDKYIVTNEPAVRRTMTVSGTTGGVHQFYGAPAGTAGNAITWTQTGSILSGTGGSVWFSPRGTSTDFRITDSGNIGFGVTSPTVKFQINTQDGFRFDSVNSKTYMQFGSATVSEGTAELSYDRTAGLLVLAQGVSGSTLANVLVINSSGNVGIGTSSPSVRLTVANGDVAVTNGVLNISRSSYPVVELNQSGSTGIGQFAMNGDNLEIRQTQAYDTLFYTNNTERVRIVSAGNVVITTTTASTSTTTGALVIAGGIGTQGASNLAATAITSLGVGTAASGTSGEIRATNNITAYFSDERLKTKLGNIDNALAKVKSLNGFYYEPNAIAEALGYRVKREVGVSAQEVQAILPEIVTGAPVDERYLTVYYDKLVPLLIEAIKELSAQVEALRGEK